MLWPPDAKNQLIGKDLDAGKEWGQEEKEAKGWDGWMAISNSMDMSLSKLPDIVKDREAWHDALHEVAKSQTWLSEQQENDAARLRPFNV